MSSEAKQRSFHLPRPLWFVIATVVLVTGGLGLRFGVPLYRRNMARLYLNGTQVTPAGIAELKRALPEARIEKDR